MPVARQQPPSAASANSSRNAEPVSVVNTGSHRASARARNSPTAQHTRDESDTESDTSASGPEPMPKTKTPYGSALRFIRQHVFLIGAFVVSALLASLTAYSYFNGQPDTPNCAMSYSRPRFLEQTSFGKSWTRFSTKYKLYLYREGGFDVYDEPYRIPVLFVPGNAGSPKQVRSIASATTTAFIEMVGRDKKVLGQGKIGYDFFSVGLNEEFTALHGYSIMEQAEFINDAIRYILSQYPRTRKRHDLGVPGAALPQSVVVVGHSMGGVVARTAFTLPNHIVGSVQAIFTLATPHSNPTASLEYYVDKVYGEINRFWRHGFHNGTLDNVSLVSIAGGNLDSMINSDYTFVGNLAPSKNSLSILSSGIEDVWLSLDHQSILWCRQMARKFAAMLVGIMDVRRPSQLLPLDVRMGYMRDTLYSALDRGAADTMGVSRRIVNGTGFGFMKVHDEGAVRVLMPDKNADSAKKSLHLVSLDRMAIDGPESVLQVISYAKKPRSQQDIGEGTASKLVFNIYGCTNPNSESDGTTSASEGLSKISCEYIHPLTAPAKLPLKAPDLDPERPVPLLEYFEVPLGHILETQKLNYIGVELPAEQAKHTGFLYVNVATKSDPIVHSPGILHLLLGSYTIGVPGSAKDTTLSTRTRIKLDVPENPFFVFRAKITMNRRRLQTTSGKPKFSTIIRQSDGRREFESKFWYDTQELDLAIHGRGAYLPSDDLANAAKENDLDTENLWDGIYIDLWADREYYSGASIKLSINWYSSLNRMVKRYDMALLALSFVWACLVVLHQLRVWNAEKVTVDKSVFPSCLASIEHLVRHGTLATLMVVAVATPVVQLTVGYLMQDLWSPKTLAAWNNLFMGVQGTGLMVCVVPALMVIVSLGFVTFEALFAEFWRNGVIGETHTVLSIVDVDDTRQSEMVGVGGGTGDPVDEYPLLDIRRR
ncbi:GPI inositol deacylase [Coemansia sp. Benny D115]|nr:GPI inositol deacylase [Coemansia sp. Benny D115]